MDQNGESSPSMLGSPAASNAPATARVTTSSAHSCHSRGDRGATAPNAPDGGPYGTRAVAAGKFDASRHVRAAACGLGGERLAGSDGNWSASIGPACDISSAVARYDDARYELLPVTRRKDAAWLFW
jgi:hypothetical protein